MTKFRTILNHERPVSPHGGLSMTDPQYLKDCDINVILRRYQATGAVPVAKSGVYGDFADIGDFATCLDKINKAKSEFEALPSNIRARFGNDPKSYVDFVLDPANFDEAVRLGLRVKPAAKEDTPVDVLKRIEKSVTPKGGNPS